MPCWLIKSEPADFSIADLERVGREPWSGVRNYQARNYMRDDMRVGDPVLFYHSSCPEPGVTGVARVASAPYPDPTQFERRSDYYDPKSTRSEPRWQLVDIEFVRRLQRTIGLDEIRAQAGRLGDIALLQRGSRLSVMPLTRRQFDRIVRLE